MTSFRSLYTTAALLATICSTSYGCSVQSEKPLLKNYTAELNRDGKPDTVTLLETHKPNAMYEIEVKLSQPPLSDGKDRYVLRTVGTISYKPSSFQVKDVNNDGLADIIFTLHLGGCNQKDITTKLINKGDGKFSP